MSKYYEQYLELYHQLKEIVDSLSDEEYDKWCDSKEGVEFLDKMDDLYWKLNGTERMYINRFL